MCKVGVLLYLFSFYVGIQSMKIPSRIVIGTRGSPLALAQAEQAKHLLQTKYPELAKEDAVIIKKIMTQVVQYY